AAAHTKRPRRPGVEGPFACHVTSASCLPRCAMPTWHPKPALEYATLPNWHYHRYYEQFHI
ncbi:MAG: hypothetical protein KDA89_16370, partial [Planctomycetaceae bacterium]|nr:hypothetical protein [Planctomycetaceae bacterium]